MRRPSLLAVFACAMALQAPASAQALLGEPGSRTQASAPRIAHDTPYPVARHRLTSQGFDPIRIVSRDDGRNGPGCTEDVIVCGAFPELQSCSADAPAACRFLYRRRSDGAYWLITTSGEPDDATPAQLRRLRYDGAWRASRADLNGLVVALPGGRRRAFSSPDPTPRCSATVTRNCWVKPPAGWRPPRG